MKRISIFALLAAGLAVLAALVGRLSAEPSAPQFRRPEQPLPIGGYHNLSYEFLSPRPFEGGKMWLSLWSGNNGTNSHHCYLYDIERKMVLGELFNAGPVFMSLDQSRLLCVHGTLAKRSPRGSLKHQFRTLLQNLWRGKLSSANFDTETFWSLDLQSGRASRLGSRALPSGSSTLFTPSPSFRFGYSKSSYPGDDLFVCDLERGSLSKRTLDGWPLGWWSDSEIVVKDSGNNFVLYDVAGDKTAPLLSQAAVAKAFGEAGLTNSPTQANLFCMWNGQQNEFYLADSHRRWQATNSYLFKVERPGGGLKLMAADFKFEWSDHFTPGGTGYVYSGREVGDRSSGVFLRDLRSGTNLTLVAADGGRSFSLPNFYRETVIYVRSNQLWQVGLDGERRTRVFPPPNQ